MGTTSMTSTYTKTNVRKVFECFFADLEMLVLRTHAMDREELPKYRDDIYLMADEGCLSEIHLQLLDASEILVRANEYSVHKGTNQESSRPGGNNWPCLPGGRLEVIIKLSDSQVYDRLVNTEKFKINWGPSSLCTNYSTMSCTERRQYVSAGYSLQRSSYYSY